MITGDLPRKFPGPRRPRPAPTPTSPTRRPRGITKVGRCTDGDGDAALQACKSALVKGAPNEFETTVRIASFSMNRASVFAARATMLHTDFAMAELSTLSSKVERGRHPRLDPVPAQQLHLDDLCERHVSKKRH